MVTTALHPAAGQPAPDRLLLSDHVREIEIGAFGEERGRRQRIRFDVAADLAASGGPVTDDDVDAILSYDHLLHAIEDALAVGRVELLETLAERIAERVLTARKVVRVTVRIEKLDRVSGALGVEIARDRHAAPHDQAGFAARARVILVGRAALAMPDADARLQRLAGAGGAVLCLDRPDAAGPSAATAAAQRQIDLLALDQAAWQLAARLPGLAVAASRTELQWGLREGRLLVWAPARLARALTQPGLSETADPRALATWLAGELAAPGLEEWGQSA